MALFDTKAPAAMKRFMAALGIKDYQAGGIMGNAGWESGGLVQLKQIHGTAIGWFQDDGARKTDFLAYCSARGWDWQSDDANIEFCIHELLSTESKALAALKATKTLKEATDAFEAYFERAGVPALSGRELYASRAIIAYAKATQSPVQAPVAAQALGGAQAPKPAPTPLPAPANTLSDETSPWSELISWIEGLVAKL